MAKKNSKTERKPLSPKPTVQQEDTAYLVREDLDEQQELLSKAEAAGAGAVRTPAPPAPAEQPPALATVPSKSLTPGGAVAGPSSAQSRVEGISSAHTTSSKGSDYVHSAKASTRPGSAVTAASCPAAAVESPGESGCGRVSRKANRAQDPQRQLCSP
jgi:hypothetical protein